MNLEDLVDDDGLQQDEWSLTRPKFGKDNQLTVVGWSGKNPSGVKCYILMCTICSQDSELFDAGYFRSLKGNLVRGRTPCGCGANARYSKEQYDIRCTRKAADLGFTFLGFVGEWRGRKTKIKLFCEKHGEWDSSCVQNLMGLRLGCPGCSVEVLGQHSIKPDIIMIESFFASGSFHPDTKFWRSDRENKRGYNTSYWFMSCPVCGETGETFVGNLQKGQRSCGCSKQRQLEGYINFVSDNENLMYIKFGIARDSKQRIKQQASRSTYKLQRYCIYTFPDVASCKQAERECKQQLECSILSRDEMPDGWTETTHFCNLEKIVEIYERNGGIRQENP